MHVADAPNTGQEHDTKKLWFTIEKALKLCLSTVHLREVASKQLTDMNKLKEAEDKLDTGRVASAIKADIATKSVSY